MLRRYQYNELIQLMADPVHSILRQIIANLMSIAPWRSPLARALHRNRSLAYSRFLQLATMRSEGHPANRTVVFRGFWAETNQLKFVTDARSEKIEQIRRHPRAEVCWYFPKTREQFRLTGTLRVIDHENECAADKTARILAWQALSEKAQEQFLWPAPGQPRADHFEPMPVGLTEPVVDFCLLLLDPTLVDHLELSGSPQNRWIYQRDQEDWHIQAVNP
jgi:pyridoxamine 5'-phosphate oxidase